MLFALRALNLKRSCNLGCLDRTWKVELRTHLNPGSSTKTKLRTHSNPFKKLELQTCLARKKAEPKPKSDKTILWALLNPGSSSETELGTHLNPPKILNPQTGFDLTLDLADHSARLHGYNFFLTQTLVLKKSKALPYLHRYSTKKCLQCHMRMCNVKCALHKHNIWKMKTILIMIRIQMRLEVNGNDFFAEAEIKSRNEFLSYV